VLEYNVRFGDPETQSILVRLDTDLVNICEAMLDGTLGNLDISWKSGASATVVLAAEGYPSTPRKGDVISGLNDAAQQENVSIFHAGTALNANGEFVTAGGRVLGVTALGDNVAQALKTAYDFVERVHWSGLQYRRDIGK
jgi:phosphoribosylamine--glycine ligase